MNIEITPKKAEGLDRTIAIRIPVDTVRDAENKAAQRYASKIRLPGFRPGKAPTAVIKKRFKDEIRQQVIEILVQDAYKEVLDREKLRVASQPHVHALEFNEGEPLTFELHVEVRPEAELARTSGFRIARPNAAVASEQVDLQIEQLRDQRAAWSPVDDRPAPQDMVTIQLATAVDGAVSEAPKEYRIVLGTGQAIPGIEELVMELEAGKSTERPVRWPDDFPDPEERGKTKTVRVTLDEVKRKALPPLDDAFAREVGDFESLDALRAAVRKDLEDHAKREADATVRQQLIDQIASANPFDIPMSWVSSLLDGYVQAYEVPETDRDRFRVEFRPVAERQVRRDFIVDTLADREGLRATEADIDARVTEVATQRGTNPAQAYASLQKAGRLKEIEQSLTEEKVFAWLLNRNEIG